MRLIDADELFDYIQKEKAWKQDTYKQPRYGRGKYDAYYEMLNIIKEQPTIDAEPVVHGHWIIKYDLGEPRGAICSNCEGEISYDRNGLFDTLEAEYCHHCGAKMDEEE